MLVAVCQPNKGAATLKDLDPPSQDPKRPKKPLPKASEASENPPCSVAEVIDPLTGEDAARLLELSEGFGSREVVAAGR